VPLALAVSFAGGQGAALCGFLLSRYLARDLLADRIPPKLRSYEARLSNNAFRTVVVMRLLFYLLPPVNWMLGLTRMHVVKYAAGTLLGSAPGTFLLVLLGCSLVSWILSLPPPVLAALAAVALVTFLCLAFRRRRAALHRADERVRQQRRDS
jgi:uncharacterized membrane protein YdjX (TVP38/TMEM64 family)